MPDTVTEMVCERPNAPVTPPLGAERLHWVANAETSDCGKFRSIDRTRRSERRVRRRTDATGSGSSPDLFGAPESLRSTARYPAPLPSPQPSRRGYSPLREAEARRGKVSHRRAAQVHEAGAVPLAGRKEPAAGTRRTVRRPHLSALYWLADEQMARIDPHFPKSHGKPRVDDRRVLSGIVFVNRNGQRWCDAAPEYGPHKTLDNRWKQRRKNGVSSSA